MNIWETQAMRISSICRIVPDNREQSDKLAGETGQAVRYEHGRGGAGEFGGSSGGGAASGNGGEENKQKLLRQYVIDADKELSHMTKRLKFVRQRTHLLVNLYGKYSQTIDVILGYLNLIQTRVQRIEVLFCLIQEFPEYSIEESLNYIEEYLRSIDSDLLAINENIKRFRGDNLKNKEQEEKRQSILISLEEVVHQTRNMVGRIQAWRKRIF